MAKVFVSAGHGGSDPGAVANGFKEKNVNLVIALACAEELQRHDVAVLLSRSTDVGTTASQDVSACNRFDPDLAVDIHNNAGGGDGAEIYHHYAGGKGKVLAENILAEMVAMGQNSRGAKTKTNSAGRDYYYFIREIAAPSVVIECAFLDNKTDLQIIDTEAEQKTMGVAIAKGILKTLGIAWIEVQVKEEAPAPQLQLPVLGKGDKGETVRALQILLIGRGYPCGSYGADGDFGAATEAALRKYQTAKGLAVDGIAGDESWRSLLGL